MVAPLVVAAAKVAGKVLVRQGAKHTIAYWAKKKGMTGMVKQLATISGNTKTMAGLVKSPIKGAISSRQFAYLTGQYNFISRATRIIDNVTEVQKMIEDPEQAAKKAANKTASGVMRDFVDDWYNSDQELVERQEVRDVLQIARNEFSSNDPQFSLEVTEKYQAMEESDQHNFISGRRSDRSSPSELMARAVAYVKQQRSAE